MRKYILTLVLIVEHDAMIRARMERLLEIAGLNWMCVGSATRCRPSCGR